MSSNKHICCLSLGDVVVHWIVLLLVLLPLMVMDSILCRHGTFIGLNAAYIRCGECHQFLGLNPI